MKKKLTIQISEGLGNQLFMYAFAYSLSKKLNYNFYIDNKFKKNIKGHKTFSIFINFSTGLLIRIKILIMLI